MTYEDGVISAALDPVEFGFINFLCYKYVKWEYFIIQLTHLQYVKKDKPSAFLTNYR